MKNGGGVASNCANGIIEAVAGSSMELLAVR